MSLPMPDRVPTYGPRYVNYRRNQENNGLIDACINPFWATYVVERGRRGIRTYAWSSSCYAYTPSHSGHT